MNNYITALMVSALFMCGTAIAQEQPPTPETSGDQTERPPRPMQSHGEMMNHRDRGMRAEGGGKDCMIEKLLDNPKLTEEIGISEKVVEEIKAKIVAMNKAQIELEAKQKLAAIDQAELMKAKKIDESAVMAAVEKSGAIHTEIAKLRITKMILLKNSLTAEQIKKAREVFGKKMKERGEGDQMMQPGEGGKQGAFRDKLKQKRSEGGKQRPKKEIDAESDDADKTQPPPLEQ